MDAHNSPYLVIEIDSQVAEFFPSSLSGDETVYLTLSLGKAAANDFVCGGEFTSRHHARIEYHHNDFFLVDNSTNGTFVQTEDEQVAHVHRDRLRLWGAGWLSLGAPLHVGPPIHFRQGD